jgi:hypothetical protein
MVARAFNFLEIIHYLSHFSLVSNDLRLQKCDLIKYYGIVFFVLLKPKAMYNMFVTKP